MQRRNCSLSKSWIFIEEPLNNYSLLWTYFQIPIWSSSLCSVIFPQTCMIIWIYSKYLFLPSLWLFWILQISFTHNSWYCWIYNYLNWLSNLGRTFDSTFNDFHQFLIPENEMSVLWDFIHVCMNVIYLLSLSLFYHCEEKPMTNTTLIFKKII